MGLRDVLTRPIGFGSSPFFWNEPALYRIRLRRDGWLRAGLVVAAWALGFGILTALFADNLHRPGLALAAGLAVLFALVACVLLFFLRDHVSGRVHVEEDEIRRYRTYGALTPGSWAEWQNWPWRAIERCMHIPNTATGRDFSLLLLEADGERDVLGIPSSISTRDLIKFLQSKGVKVEQGKAVPGTYRQPLTMAGAGGFAAVAFCVLAGGMFRFQSVRGGKERPREPIENEFAQQAFPAPGGFPPGNDWGRQAGPEAAAPPAAVPGVATDAQAAPSGFGGRRFGPGFGGPGPNAADVPGAPPGFPGGPFVPGGAPSAPPGGIGPAPAAASDALASKTDRTELVGAPGGFDFARVNAEVKPVVGFRSNFGSWAGKRWIGRLEPLYGDEAPAPGWTDTRAKAGYAVGGLLIDTPEFVNAYAVIFMKRREDGSLDPDDSYTSEWVGPKSDGTPEQLSGEGRVVCGVHGRAGAILNAVGLVLVKR